MQLDFVYLCFKQNKTCYENRKSLRKELHRLPVSGRAQGQENPEGQHAFPPQYGKDRNVCSNGDKQDP